MVDLSQLVPLASQFGPLGLLIWYLVWRENNARKDLKEQFMARLEVDKAETASRLDLAKALSFLSMVVQGKPDV